MVRAGAMRGVPGVYGIAFLLAAAKLLAHLLTNGQYGYFRDELYFLACGERLAWGYPDMAPMLAGVAWFTRNFVGESLSAVRLLPAVAGALKVLMTGLIARELGGGRFAVGLACLCALLAPVYLGVDTLLSMNAFEPLFWMGCAWLAVRMAKGGDPRLWLAVGLLAGLGLMNKHSTVFLLAALGGGLLASRQRGLLRGKWPWLGVAVAFALFVPNLIWQVQHDFATVEVLRNVQRTHKNVVLGPVEFIGQQILIMLPAAVLVWGAGLWWLLGRRGSGRFGFLGFTYVVLLTLMIIFEAKHYYLAPAYPMLFAAGGVFWEQMSGRWGARLRSVVNSLVTVSGVALAPLMLPVLPVEKYLSYQDAMGFKPPKTEVGHVGPLPQHFGDMFGWPEMVEKVAQVYHGLPGDERGKAAVLAGNYGEAGAVDFFGRRHGLPKAISGHLAYYLWGPKDYTGEVLILLQFEGRGAKQYCASVEEAGRVGHPYGMAEEHFTILVCRGLKQPLKEFWPRLKHYR